MYSLLGGMVESSLRLGVYVFDLRLKKVVVLIWM